MTFEVEVPPTALEAPLTFAGFATDTRGKQSATVTLSIMVADTTPPNVQIVSPSEGSKAERKTADSSDASKKTSSE